MAFKVFRIAAPSEIDSVPVAVIKHYPLEKRDYKPYAQCNLCLCEDGLLLRMWAFEVSPPEGSELCAVLYLFPDKPDAALSVSLRPEGLYEIALLRGDASRFWRHDDPPPGFVLAPHSGEDLQGVYWGATAALPLDWLREVGGKVSLEPGESLRGNFYKLCPGPDWAHSGSFFPADFAADRFGAANMGELVVAAW